MDIQNTSNINLTDNCDKQMSDIDNLQSIDNFEKSTNKDNDSTNINYTNYLSSDLDGCENWGVDG